MNVSLRVDEIGTEQRWPWNWTVFYASALAIPISYGIGAGLSGEMFSGQGLEASPYWLFFIMIQVLSFGGFICAPLMSWRPGNSKVTVSLLVLVSAVCFVADELLSTIFIMIERFPD